MENTDLFVKCEVDRRRKPYYNPLPGDIFTTGDESRVVVKSTLVRVYYRWKEKADIYNMLMMDWIAWCLGTKATVNSVFD